MLLLRKVQLTRLRSVANLLLNALLYQMTVNDIIRHRLNVQQLSRPAFTKPGEVVSWLGAVQAQDYLGALWSVGLRMKKSVEADVEKAIADKAMVRTWPMR